MRSRHRNSLRRRYGHARTLTYKEALAFYVSHGYPPVGWRLTMQGLRKVGA